MRRLCRVLTLLVCRRCLLLLLLQHERADLEGNHRLFQPRPRRLHQRIRDKEESASESPQTKHQRQENYSWQVYLTLRLEAQLLLAAEMRHLAEIIPPFARKRLGQR